MGVERCFGYFEAKKSMKHSALSSSEIYHLFPPGGKVRYNGGIVDQFTKQANFSMIFFDMAKTCILSIADMVRPDDKPWYNSEIR